MKVRYYFWQYYNTGWRQLGAMNGYSTLKECKKDNEVYTKEEYKYIILKATPIS